MHPPPCVCALELHALYKEGAPRALPNGAGLAAIGARGRKLGRGRPAHRPVQLWAGKPKIAMQPTQGLSVARPTPGGHLGTSVH